MTQAATTTQIFDILTQDHRDVMQRLDRILASPAADMESLRMAFAPVRAMLLAHALAEERAFYSRLKQNARTEQTALSAGGEHEIMTRLIEDLSGYGLNRDEFLSLLRGLADLTREHIETEEGPIFAEARQVFDRAMLDEMARSMIIEKSRMLQAVA